MTELHSHHSPFNWRYDSDEMRKISSEEVKHILCREIRVVVQVQAALGLVSPNQAYPDPGKDFGHSPGICDRKRDPSRSFAEQCAEQRRFPVGHDIHRCCRR